MTTVFLQRIYIKYVLLFVLFSSLILHQGCSKPAQTVRDQAVDQAADRLDRGRPDHPDDGDIVFVDGDGEPGRPSAG